MSSSDTVDKVTHWLVPMPLWLRCARNLPALVGRVRKTSALAAVSTARLLGCTTTTTGSER